jgi:hypothetical protein
VDANVRAHRESASTPTLIANQAEHALVRLLRAGGKGVMDNSGEAECARPADPVLRISNLKVKTVEGGTIKATHKDQTLTIRTAPHTRIRLDGVVAEASALKPGDSLALCLPLSALKSPPLKAWPEKGTPNKPATTVEHTIGDTVLTLLLTAGGMQGDHDLLGVSEIKGSLPALNATWIQAQRESDPKQAFNLWHNFDSIWRGGTVKGIDPETRTVTIIPWQYNTKSVNGRSILESWQRAGKTVYLDAPTKARHACVERWIRDAGNEATYYLDDATIFTLNGRFVAGFSDLRTGDRISVRYRCRHDGETPTRATMVRISRVEE